MVVPQIDVRKMFDEESAWLVTTVPYVETCYELLNTAYTNVTATTVSQTLQQDTVRVLCTKSPPPDGSIKAALHRLVLAHWWRGQTDSNPPKTWKAVQFLVAVKSPEAWEVAWRYQAWNAAMARELWNLSREEYDLGLRHTFRKHSEARYNVDSKLREFLREAPLDSELD